MPYKYSAEGMFLSCFKKARYKSINRARAVAEKYNQRVYFCPICGKYHLTSKNVSGSKDVNLLNSKEDLRRPESE